MNLTEVANELNISSSWINKIQNRTGICKSNLGKPGKEPYFSNDDMRNLRLVKILRTLGYNLDKIESIYYTHYGINLSDSLLRGLNKRINNMIKDMSYIRDQISEDERLRDLGKHLRKE